MKSLSDISVFLSDGSDQQITAAELHAKLEDARRHVARPFSQERMEVVAEISRVILKQKAQHSPAVMHFAFFTRAAALRKLASDCHSRLPAQSHARARGLAFHLPPQNVETVFLYSWLLSYLSGNANIVRMPREISPEMRRICNLFIKAAEEAGDRSQLFVYYPSSASDLGQSISAISDARIVWGGDAKIATFASLPLRNGGKSIWFGDRFSLCLLEGDTVLKLDEAEKKSLCHRLFNDIFVFDQMACSSPQVMYVVGNTDRHLEAINDLLETLGEVARERQESPAAGHQIAKMVQSFSSAAAGQSVLVNWRDDRLTTMLASSPERQDHKVGGGFMRVAFLEALDDILPLLKERDQTITYVGFSSESISSVAQDHLGSGVSRWVPVGAALDFDSIWDGYDLPFEFTRLVRTQ